MLIKVVAESADYLDIIVTFILLYYMTGINRLAHMLFNIYKHIYQ
jgi:hypothetical protein